MTSPGRLAAAPHTAPACRPAPHRRDAGQGYGFAVTSDGLTKRFRGGQIAVDHIDLAVPPASVYGFLGPERLGQDHHHPDAARPGPADRGHAHAAGRPDSAGLATGAAAGSGALVEGPAFHPYLSGRDNLRRLDAADRTADPAHLRSADRRRAGPGRPQPPRPASGTATTRWACGSGWASPRRCCSPGELLILDEPTNGLDPQGTREVRSLVSDLAATGVTVLLSTHLLSEVEQICTHVGVMHIGAWSRSPGSTDLRAQTAPRIRVDTDRPGRRGGAACAGSA